MSDRLTRTGSEVQNLLDNATPLEQGGMMLGMGGGVVTGIALNTVHSPSASTAAVQSPPYSLNVKDVVMPVGEALGLGLVGVLATSALAIRIRRGRNGN